ncbi:hypothetical protein MTY59_48720 [Mycobacterium senriense]|uniref:Uncharacterized protein n=1 Tax=Mycobacterium senriense TaxID=2775496 RepID=A0ABN6ISL2_9MYCO|nr:hypothetical protein MTY59_48720 [Mycobacterium senriense]
MSLPAMVSLNFSAVRSSVVTFAVTPGADPMFPDVPGVRNAAIDARGHYGLARPGLVTVAYVFPRPTDWA